MTEAHALTLCIKHRDPAGFEFLVKKYRREAYFHALGFMGDSSDAADACQEAFTRAFGSLPKLERLESFYPWFYRILRNYCFNILARRKTAKTYEEAVANEIRSDSPSADVSVLMQKSEESALVWRILNELQPEFREILLLKYREERSYEEISARMGIPRGTVMSRLYYARKTFKDAYLRESAKGGNR